MSIDSDFRTPGQLIKKLLDDKGWSQRVLAIIIGMKEPALAKILVAKQKVDAELAIRLGEAFGVNPRIFLDLQSSYDLEMAKFLSRPDPSRAIRASLFGELPIADMIKRGWLEADDVRDVPKVEAALAKFFGVNSIDEIEILPHAAKKTNVSSDATGVQLAWLHRVRVIANETLVGRYSPEAVADAIVQLKTLTSAPEQARKVPRILAERGIRFILTESLPSAKIDGVCFWLNDKSPVIGMSLRFDRIDNFWFVLRHELEHVACQHGRTTNSVLLDTNLEGERAGVGESVGEEERIANGAAAEFCVPQKKLQSFIARKSPFFSERDLLGFANTLQVHPGIVAGLLQHETGRFNLFRDHLVKIRHHIAPSAIVDGWGDVYPVEN